MKSTSLVFDWDLTLSPVDMIHCILDGVMSPKEYWALLDQSPVKTRELVTHVGFTETNQSGMFGRIHNKTSIAEAGKNIPLYPGALEFMNKVKGVIPVHIITVGTIDFIVNHPLVHLVDSLQGCSYLDEAMTIIKELITPADKVRCIENVVGPDYGGVIYVGDGYSDYWAMKAVLSHGGKAVAVYHDESSYKRTLDLDAQLDGKLSLICEADYSEGSPFDIFVNECLIDADELVR